MPKHSVSRRKLMTALLGSLGLLIPVNRPASAKKLRRLRKWQCTNQDCDPYIYDPSKGDENLIDTDRPIPPGISFENLPDNWICPVCSDPKSFFVPMKETVMVEVSS